MASVVEDDGGAVILSEEKTTAYFIGDKCPNPKCASTSSMPKWKDDTTDARACSICGYVEERFKHLTVITPLVPRYRGELKGVEGLERTVQCFMELKDSLVRWANDELIKHPKGAWVQVYERYEVECGRVDLPKKKDEEKTT